MFTKAFQQKSELRNQRCERLQSSTGEHGREKNQIQLRGFPASEATDRVVHPLICEELLHLLIRPQFPCQLPRDVSFSVSNCTKCFSLSCQPQKPPSSLPYSLQNNLVEFCFLLTTYLNLFTLIPTATLIEQITPCVPHDHIFSLLYSLAPHTPSTLCYLPPPPLPMPPDFPFSPQTGA